MDAIFALRRGEGLSFRYAVEMGPQKHYPTPPDIYARTAVGHFRRSKMVTLVRRSSTHLFLNIRDFYIK